MQRGRAEQVVGEFAAILGEPMTAGLAAALVLVTRKPATA